jgi:translation initiation factor IF-1
MTPAARPHCRCILQEQHFQAIRNHIDRVHGHHTTLTAFLQHQPNNSLMHICFWMRRTGWIRPADRFMARSHAYRHTGARVVFRTGGSQSPLEENCRRGFCSNGKPILNITAACTRPTALPSTAVCICTANADPDRCRVEFAFTIFTGGGGSVADDRESPRWQPLGQ